MSKSMQMTWHLIALLKEKENVHVISLPASIKKMARRKKKKQIELKATKDAVFTQQVPISGSEKYGLKS